MGTLPNEVGALGMEDTEKMQLLNAYFPSVFTAKDNLHQLQAMGARECLEKGRFFPFAEVDNIRDHLGNFNIQKIQGPHKC